MEEVEISINYVSFKWTKFRPETILSAESVDMTIATVDCNKIKVHQTLMSSISPFFENILKEIDPSGYPVIVLTDIEFPEIQAICEFLYNGEVLVPTERVPLLMKAADKLQIKGLAREVEEQVIEESVPGELEIENAVQDINTLESDNYLQIEAETLSKILEEPKPEKKVVRRRIKKVKKEKKLPFPAQPLKTATVATIASTDMSDDGTTTATLTTHVVPIVSTILIDTPVPMSCDVCGVTCENERILAAHKKIHQGKYIVHTPKDETKKAIKHLVKTCPYCPYASEHITSLSQHIRTHTGEKPYKCEVCDKAFPRKTSLTDHMRSHTGERPFACDQCDKKFTQKHILQNHTATIHSNGAKPFKCDYCEKCFSIKKALHKHMETHKLKTLRKRITDDSEEIEELIEEIEEVSKKKVKPRRKKKKLINELTASDYSEESDPEFKCDVMPDKLDNIEQENEESENGKDIETKDNQNNQVIPLRKQPKRNVGKPKRSLTPSPPPLEKPRIRSNRKTKPEEKKKKIYKRTSDPINASDYFYYKNSYNINPPNLPSIYVPPAERTKPTEYIIEL